MKRLGLALVVLATAIGVHPGPAGADGDPGSDVLVYQSLFLEADAGISVGQQSLLGSLLTQARRAGFPIRVAIIGRRYDLGAITELWRQPRAYARFLGLELSQAYTGRLLVVMPNGLGFNWPGHSATPAYTTLSRIAVGPGGPGLAEAAERGIVSLAAAAGVRLTPTAAATGPQPARPAGAPAPHPGQPGSNLDTLVAGSVVALGVLIGLALLARRLLNSERPRRRKLIPGLVHSRLPIAALGILVLPAAAIGGLMLARGSPSNERVALAMNPNLDPGTPVSGPAPAFTLTDQFGRAVSLRSFQGKVVLLAFNDSECTTICPLTTTAMLDAKAMLGRAGQGVQLLGVDANPKATSLEDVLSYSELHGMLHSWHFLTGSLPQLRRVWKDYGIEAAVQGGQIAHTPALFVIDPHGRLSRLFVTSQSYAAVGQLAQLLAQASSNLLPGHPAVHSGYRYSQITGLKPTARIALPEAGGGTLALGPGQPRLMLFFASWDRQVTGLASGLERLNGYSTLAARMGLPALDAVDEASVEPPGALHQFLGTLPHPLRYPIGLDRTGRVGDGYEVEGLPWLVLVSSTGRIVWYYSVAALGWPRPTFLMADVRAALAHVAGPSVSVAAAAAQLRGSPPPLQALHRQASRLLGGDSALAARLRALRGHPVVINFWASWCPACRSEFGLFASAAARYGRRVAFLGEDTADSSGDAQAFLRQHPVTYPSYQTSYNGLDWLVPQGLAGLPTTIFLGPDGKVVYVHIGEYDAQGTLDQDIADHALAH